MKEYIAPQIALKVTSTTVQLASSDVEFNTDELEF